MKKILAILMVVVMMMGATVALSACGETTATNSIAILVPGDTHGWAGAVRSYSDEKAKEINDAGKYTATVQTSSDAAGQIALIEDITANKNYAAVVILPFDNSVGTALEALVATGIPVVQFDRAIDSVRESVVSTVLGDNEGIGYETAKRFLANGLTKTDKILLLQGDLSSVPGMRTDGFKKGLKEIGNWTDADITASIVDLGSTGWQRTTAETLFTDWINGATDAEVKALKFVFTHDDPIAMGVMDALTKSSIDTAKLDAFFGSPAKLNLASSAGAAENYTMMKGNLKNEDIQAAYNRLGDYFSVSYDPGMIKDAIDVIIKHLEGSSVDKTTVIPAQVVDKTNVDDFRGFGPSESK